MTTSLAFKILVISAVLMFIVRQISALYKKKFTRLITTPMITYFICGLAVVGIYNYGTGREWLIPAALGLSLIADSVLMIEGADLFMHGLIFFLMTHACYNIAFCAGYTFAITDCITGSVLLAMMIFLVWRFRKSGKLGNMMIPVILYISVLSLVVYFSVNGFLRTGESSRLLIMCGAVLFYISDVILGWTKFVKYFRLATFYIWLFYAPGQFLIALSLFY